MDLPVFTYYADPVGDGRITASDATCSACEQARGHISSALLYTANPKGDGQFCPWCIADGTAVARFGGTFNDVEPGGAAAATEEVEQRTPNFERWQDWDWPLHCAEPMVYLGSPEPEELRTYTDAYDALRDELRRFEWGDDEDAIYGMGLYLFRCRGCGVRRARWDLD